MELENQGAVAEMPLPLNTAYGGHLHMIHHDSQPPAPALVPQQQQVLHLPNSNHNSPPPPPPPPPVLTDHEARYNNNSKKAVIKYKECLKNHAASIGGNAIDGCGEFMPSGEEGSLEALTCSACNCHRNFHRKDTDTGDDDDHHHQQQHHSLYDITTTTYHHHHHPSSTLSLNRAAAAAAAAAGRRRNMLLGNSADLEGKGAIVPSRIALPPPPPQHQYPHHHPMMMSYNMMGSLAHNSESDEQEGGGGGGVLTAATRPAANYHHHHDMVKKRYRTKFSQEQKEKMFNFAEKSGWKIQKQEESVVQQFCQEIGVRRRVLKVWMHNNKHNLAKKNTSDHHHAPNQLQR